MFNAATARRAFILFGVCAGVTTAPHEARAAAPTKWEKLTIVSDCYPEDEYNYYDSGYYFRSHVYAWNTIYYQGSTSMSVVNCRVPDTQGFRPSEIIRQFTSAYVPANTTMQIKQCVSWADGAGGTCSSNVLTMPGYTNGTTYANWPSFPETTIWTGNNMTVHSPFLSVLMPLHSSLRKIVYANNTSLP